MKTSDNRLAVALALVVCAGPAGAGCKKEPSPSNKAASEKPAGKAAGVAKKPPGPAETPADWSGKPLAPVNDQVDGAAFAVHLPDGLKREEKKSDGTFPGYVTWNAKGNPFIAPGFTVQLDAMPPASLASAASQSTILNPKLVVSRKEAIPGGFLVTVHEPEKRFIKVTAWRKTGAGKHLRITVTQRNSNAIPNFAAQRGWMEKVAKSLAAR